ncbi:Uncharacterised protein [Burkholderia pseudomallei]|nr:Uncharacterised protein [Burkholderia pseudomallei]
MHLNLTIDSKPLAIEIDDVIVGLLAIRLNLPENADPRDAISRHLSEAGGRGYWTRNTCENASFAG